MYRPRSLVYALVCLGLVFIYVPEMAGLSPRLLGLGFLCKSFGMLMHAPGLAVVTAVAGFSFARSVGGHLLCWALTLLLWEPVLRWIEKPGRRDPQNGGVEVTRRALLLAGGGVAAAGVVAGYGTLYELRNLQLEQFRLWLPNLPPELEGTRLVLMSDWHCGPFNRPGDLRPAIELANRCRPDLVLLPGDFTSKSGRYFAEAAELVRHLRPSIPNGLLLSWGNHDYWHGIEPGLKLMPEAGCQILTNRCLVLTPKRELDSGGRGLCLAGIDDLWAGKPDLSETLRDVPADQPRVVLCHNPDVAELQSGPRVDLMLSGHTHGGQVRIPAIGAPIVPSRYGQKYAQGLVEGPHYPVYVSRGVGTSGVPVRLGVPPEVTVFELHRGEEMQLRRARLV